MTIDDFPGGKKKKKDDDGWWAYDIRTTMKWALWALYVDNKVEDLVGYMGFHFSVGYPFP